MLTPCSPGANANKRGLSGKPAMQILIHTSTKHTQQKIARNTVPLDDSVYPQNQCWPPQHPRGPAHICMCPYGVFADPGHLRKRSPSFPLCHPCGLSPSGCEHTHTHTPVSRLHRRTELSSDPDTIVRPSGVTATAVTSSVCPCRVFSSSPVMQGRSQACATSV